jgi:restriction system protein
MRTGDYVVFPSKSDRKINIGIIESNYLFNPEAAPYANQRKVKWLKHLPRTAFKQGPLYEVGSALTLFSVKNYADEFLASLEKTSSVQQTTDENDDTVAITANGIIESTTDFILKELSKHLKGYSLEPFVADLFNAMGYRTMLSPQGGDSGVDITAYKDELPPRILVQVKSQDGDIKEAAVQSLRGAMREGDYGVFVALSSYSKKAREYLDATPIIRGIDGADLAELVLKNYDKLSEKSQRVIPLKMVYIPVVTPGEAPNNETHRAMVEAEARSLGLLPEVEGSIDADLLLESLED